MSKRVPEHLREIYGSAHNFRANKRRIVDRMLRDLSELRRGCAYLPTGVKPVAQITEGLMLLKKELRTRSWGK